MSTQHLPSVLSLLEAYPAHYLRVLVAIGKHPGEIQELLAQEALPGISMKHFCIYAYRLIEDGCVLRIPSPFCEETLLYYLTPQRREPLRADREGPHGRGLGSVARRATAGCFRAKRLSGL